MRLGRQVQRIVRQRLARRQACILEGFGDTRIVALPIANRVNGIKTRPGFAFSRQYVINIQSTFVSKSGSLSHNTIRYVFGKRIDDSADVLFR